MSLVTMRAAGKEVAQLSGARLMVLGEISFAAYQCGSGEELVELLLDQPCKPHPSLTSTIAS